MDESKSLAQEAFRWQRALFEQQFEEFLVSLATPIDARRQEAEATVRRLCEVSGQLRDQGVL